jgi:hypothetical protein
MLLAHQSYLEMEQNSSFPKKVFSKREKTLKDVYYAPTFGLFKISRKFPRSWNEISKKL